ncbi:unnamed protein product [Adineta steineri]|uniref:X-ray radiation resistance-associated protein 1 n=1 Tax=Adineta steineri TaxID=433720 RepID=A0A813RFK5_9BILA|nr:unnamed protein product [Adineta steineri]CAF0780756.1 unnamed protein product [Adineta steineri]CAF1072446.1 unnamed protein product [Adineta steineri]
MSTLPWIKYDNGPLSGNENHAELPTNCFPVRNILRSSSSNQQWVVALRDTEQRRFAAILTTLSAPTPFETEITQTEIKKKQRWAGKEQTVEHLLDGFFIMHHCAIEDPSNVVILRVNGLELQDVTEEDFLLFDNVLQIDASENQLPFHGFKTFPQLMQLDLSFNQIKNIKINVNDYETLEELNLSFNNLTMHDIETLGMLPSLRTLHATGNDLVGLPRRFAKSYIYTDIHGKEYVKERYPRLEELYLNQNKFVEDELFIYLSSLKKLKRLHLQNNHIHTIPFLKVLQGRQIVQEYSKSAMKRKRTENSNSSGNSNQDITASSNDDIVKSTIFEEDEENVSSDQKQTTIASTDQEISLPPFPELQYLDLSSNLIEDEDDVMAIASWPSLTEIILVDNPLIQRHVGLPPLIENFLIDRLGMKIHRTNPSLKSEKQFYAKPIKKHRKVNTRVAKVPKIPIDQLLSGAVKQYIDYVKTDTDVTTNERALTGISEQNFSSDEDKFKTNDSTLNDIENKYNNDTSTDNLNSNEQTENIFMTEFENEDIYPNETTIEQSNRSESKEQTQTSLVSNEKFKGFEIFLDIDNEKDIPVPNNVIHCVRDLKQILRNPLVIRHDKVQVDRVQRTFVPQRMERTLPPIKLPNKPKIEEINKLLDIIRDRKTIIDQPLGQILNNNKDKVSQRRAKSLVTEIQRHYEQVRSISLRSVRTPGTTLDRAINRLQRFDTNISLKKPNTDT